jgi:hypothetical protein
MEEVGSFGTIQVQAMLRSLRGLLVAITLGVVVGFALGGDDRPKHQTAEPAAKGKDDVFGHERFCVTVWPAKTQVSAGEEFEVKLRVVNSSQEPQSFRVASCSWYMDWKSSNPHIGFTPWPCWRNAIVDVTLQPGEAYEKALVMKLVGEGRSRTESLRMGFTPGGEKTSYWSNEVVLGVK